MKKILIIEDEEAIAMIEQDYLELSILKQKWLVMGLVPYKN